MKFVAAEGKHPLQNLDMIEHYSFPRELLRVGFLYNYWYGHMLHTEVVYIYIYIYIYICICNAYPSHVHRPWWSIFSQWKKTCHCSSPGFKSFWRWTMCATTSWVQYETTFTESWAETKGECGCVYIASFSAYLFCIINYTSLFFSFFRLWFLYIKIMCSHSSQPSMYPATDQKLRIFLSNKHVSLFYYCGIVPTRHCPS